jgi:hypothetical protein
VEGARATVVARVQGGEQRADLGTAHLADHEAVGAHAQALADEVGERHLTGALHVRGPGDQADELRVDRRQLTRVLHAHDPFAR